MIKIVLADDHEIVRNGIKQLLQSESDIQVVGEASNGKESIQKVFELKPDILISDISMPEMDGITLLKILRDKEKKEEAKNPPFIIYSTECSEELKNIAKNFKAAAWLLKPAKAKTILLALNKIAQTSKTQGI